MAERYLRGVDAALRGAALPYGYTLTVWGTGAALTHLHGDPNVGELLLFAAGAAAAYGMLKIVSHRPGGSERDLAGSPHVFRAGLIHVGGIGLGIGAAALIARIGSGVAWPLATFASTSVYMAVTSIEIALVGGPGASG
jgi:hypothetical protein